MVKFLLGCAVWSYKDWVGDFYPPGSRPNEFLSLYSRRFPTVEGNTTFYAVPDRKTVDRWASQTPENFEFCPKLPREITHGGSLISAIPAASNFRDRMNGLGGNLGPIFAQLPPTYGPTQWEDLQEFLQAWPRDIPLALEVRHPDWFEEKNAETLNDLLQNLGVGRVLLDSRPVYLEGDDPQARSHRKKPDLPVQFSVTASFCLIRFISHPQLSLNQPFLESWIPKIDEYLKKGIRVYFFVHCPEEVRSPHTARHFQSLLEQHRVPVPPLPWNTLEQPPIQLSLW